MIAIIDYKLGNIASLTAALDRLGQDYIVTNDAAVIQQADRVILPGVGRARPAMEELRRLELVSVLQQLRQPVLGICLGAQLLCEWSEEDSTECLGIIPARVKRFQSKELSIPHIGWNTVQQTGIDTLFTTVPDNAYMYFVNSYYLEPGPWMRGATQYSQSAATVVRWNNYIGTQFHPEKSGEAGLQLLRNFCTGESIEVWPAIDILDGKCVRLRQGDYTAVTEYSENPVEVAKQFAKQGVAGIHVVDLDAAKAGKPVNQKLIQAILEAVTVPVEVGGGIRTVETVQKYLALGVARVIIGTAAFTQPAFVLELVQQFGTDRIVVGLDVKNNKPAIQGWQETVELSLQESVAIMKQAGVNTMIVTDIRKDGMMEGPNLELMKQIIQQGIQVIVSGGVRNIDDVSACAAINARGVIIGKAMYQQPEVAPEVHLTKRIIPCMDIADGRVVKGTNFTKLKDSGDPVELAKLYCEQGADELVFLDIMATVEQRDTLYDLVSAVAKEINIPFTVGGGVRDITDMERLLQSGADKVSIGSMALTHPEFIQAAAERFGSQCIVISVDPKWNAERMIWEAYSKGGRENTGRDVVEFVQQMEQLGAGELLVNSLDRDGMKTGYDIPLLQAIKQAVDIPVIASSGVGTMEHFIEAFTQANIDAVLAASVFHKQELSVIEVKKYLSKKNITVRLSTSPPASLPPLLSGEDSERINSPSNKEGARGRSMNTELIPVIIQNYLTSQVLMLGYMNEEAYAKTLETGEVWFYSRSKQRLWKKGETSGNVLRVVSLSIDCDSDTILIQAEPAGPTCHTGLVSCFANADVPMLEELARIIQDRKTIQLEESYTAKLLAGGVEAIGEKIEEEAEEVVRAVREESDQRVIEEAADVLYHLWVLLGYRDVSYTAVLNELKRRHNT